MSQRVGSNPLLGHRSVLIKVAVSWAVSQFKFFKGILNICIHIYFRGKRQVFILQSTQLNPSILINYLQDMIESNMFRVATSR